MCHGGQHSNVGGVYGVLTWLTRVECWCGKRPRVSCVDDVLTLVTGWWAKKYQDVLRSIVDGVLLFKLLPEMPWKWEILCTYYTRYTLQILCTSDIFAHFGLLICLKKVTWKFSEQLFLKLSETFIEVFCFSSRFYGCFLMRGTVTKKKLGKNIPRKCLIFYQFRIKV